MFVIKGTSNEIKDFFFSEDVESKNKIFLQAYEDGFTPLSVYEEIPEDRFDKYQEIFEDIKENKSLEIMDFSKDILVDEIDEEEGVDLDSSTFLDSNEFASI